MLDAFSSQGEPPARSVGSGALGSLPTAALASPPLGAMALAALGLLLLPDCNRPQSPSITPHLVRVAAVGESGLELDVQLQVHNPNSFPLAAEAVQGTLYVARDQKLGVGQSHPRDSIPAEGSSIVASQLHVGWENLTALAPLLAFERIPCEFRGDVTLGGESLHITLPFVLTGELSRTQLLQAGLRGL
jgi:LEA14-like dessication related protein